MRIKTVHSKNQLNTQKKTVTEKMRGKKDMKYRKQITNSRSKCFFISDYFKCKWRTFKRIEE